MNQMLLRFNDNGTCLIINSHWYVIQSRLSIKEIKYRLYKCSVVMIISSNNYLYAIRELVYMQLIDKDNCNVIRREHSQFWACVCRIFYLVLTNVKSVRWSDAKNHSAINKPVILGVQLLSRRANHSREIFARTFALSRKSWSRILVYRCISMFARS